MLVWLGKVSYGLYLWHYVFVRSDIPIWAALPLSVAAAAASCHLVEEPVRRLRERLEHRSAPVAVPRLAVAAPFGPLPLARTLSEREAA